MTDLTDKQRLDKWLWAARFYKTRTLASQAIEGGKVHVNGERVKSSRVIKIGDAVSVSREQVVMNFIICSLNMQRRPASETQTWYKETAESIALRQKNIEQNKLLGAMMPKSVGRPSKKDRRKIAKFIDIN